MRSRTGRRFAEILAAVRVEFGDADPIRLGEVVRLRMISEAAQRDCLAGKVPLDRLVRVQNLVIRAEKQLSTVTRGTPAPAGADLRDYLAALADGDDVEAEGEPADVDGARNERPSRRRASRSPAEAFAWRENHAGRSRRLERHGLA
jgi:hypothetical protein